MAGGVGCAGKGPRLPKSVGARPGMATDALPRTCGLYRNSFVVVAYLF